jgi:hypothetical protein
MTAPLPAQAPRNVARAGSLARHVQRAEADTLLSTTPRRTLSAQGTPQRGPATYMNIGFSGLMDFGWSSEADVTALQRGDHDPLVRGFTIPNEELTLDGAVDPYFKGFVDVVYKIDAAGESAFELEEAYILTSSLPANLQIKAGSSSPNSGGRTSSTRTRGCLSTSRWCSTRCSAPTACAGRVRD